MKLPTLLVNVSRWYLLHLLNFLLSGQLGKQTCVTFDCAFVLYSCKVKLPTIVFEKELTKHITYKRTYKLVEACVLILKRQRTDLRFPLFPLPYLLWVEIWVKTGSPKCQKNFSSTRPTCVRCYYKETISRQYLRKH